MLFVLPIQQGSATSISVVHCTVYATMDDNDTYCTLNLSVWEMQHTIVFGSRAAYSVADLSIYQLNRS